MLIQTKQGSSGAYTNSFSFSFASDITAGNLLVLCFTAGSADVISTGTAHAISIVGLTLRSAGGSTSPVGELFNINQAVNRASTY